MANVSYAQIIALAKAACNESEVEIKKYIEEQDYVGKAEVEAVVAEAVSEIGGFNFKKVDVLPTTGEPNTIYLVRKTGTTNDIYEEWYYIGGDWELLGTAEVNLSNYYTKDEIDAMMGDVAEALDMINGDTLDKINEALDEIIGEEI